MRSHLLVVVLVSAAFVRLCGSDVETGRLTFRVSGCAETDTGMASDTRSVHAEMGPRIEAVGRAIHYTRAGGHQCCRKVVIEKHVHERQITIVEYWTGKGCRCHCFSRIDATISELVPGDYRVEVLSGGIEVDSEQPINPVTLTQATVRVE